MKIKLCVLTAFAGLFLVFGSAPVCYGQRIPPGGYFPAKVKDAQVVEAAKFAVKERSETQATGITLVSIKKAKTQVVAGRNYKICMTVDIKDESDRKAVRQFVEVVVYRNLKRVFSLTNWTVLQNAADCR